MNTYIGSTHHKQNCKLAGVKGNLAKQKRAKLKREEYNNSPKLCELCKTPIHYDKRLTNRFCSSSCSAKQTNKLKKPRTHESRLKMSEKMLKINKELRGQSWQIKYENCRMCNKLFTTRVSSTQKTCSKICRFALYSVNGRKVAQKRVIRSKDEIHLYNLCKDKYTNVSSNKIIINGWDADIFLEDYNIAILWNGPWHYKEMRGLKNHSLKQVKTRDKIKTKLFTELGLKVFVFEDRAYTPETAFLFLTKYISSLTQETKV